DPSRDRWQLYGTGGWALAEGTPRGEVGVSWGETVAPDPLADRDMGARLTAYRRLRDLRAFRPTYDWDWIYTLPAALWGSDRRDYYDAAGIEGSVSARRGRWTGSLGGRVESHDAVAVNTTRYL